LVLLVAVTIADWRRTDIHFPVVVARPLYWTHSSILVRTFCYRHGFVSLNHWNRICHYLPRTPAPATCCRCCPNNALGPCSSPLTNCAPPSTPMSSGFYLPRDFTCCRACGILCPLLPLCIRFLPDALPVAAGLVSFARVLVIRMVPFASLLLSLACCYLPSMARCMVHWFWVVSRLF